MKWQVVYVKRLTTFKTESSTLILVNTIQVYLSRERCAFIKLEEQSKNFTTDFCSFVLLIKTDVGLMIYLVRKVKIQPRLN